VAIPTIVGIGATNHGITSAVTYTLPSHQAGDILILACEDQSTAGLTAPSGGWAHITNSPRAQGSNVIAVNVFWKRATSAAETDPQVPAASNHQAGFAMSIRGCITSGNPWDFAPVGSGAAAATTASMTGGTTSGADRLVFAVLAGNTDIATDQFSAGSNGNLANFAKQGNSWTTDGGGGGVDIYTGELAAAGATGTTTATMASLTYSALVFALVPNLNPPLLVMAPRNY
jgi:hypothetical protein